jgi:hypothetical protein
MPDEGTSYKGRNRIVKTSPMEAIPAPPERLSLAKTLKLDDIK